MKQFALLGHDIAYSLSPKIHAALFDYLGVDATYKLISVAPEQLLQALRELFALNGFNVTKPYKRRIVEFLDGVDGGFEAVNTVVMKNGKRIGYNTDYFGFENHFLKLADPKGARVLVLGAGGAAEVVVPFLVSRGAEVYVHNRTEKTAAQFCARHGVRQASDQSGRYEIVVNCTAFGQNAGENAGAGIDFTKTKIAYDLFYFETEFLRSARGAGVLFVENGLPMLIYQAIRAQELFFDIAIRDKEALLNQITKELQNERN